MEDINNTPCKSSTKSPPVERRKGPKPSTDDGGPTRKTPGRSASNPNLMLGDSSKDNHKLPKPMCPYESNQGPHLLRSSATMSPVAAVDEWTVVNRTTSSKRKVAKRRYRAPAASPATTHNNIDSQQQDDPPVDPGVLASHVRSCCQQLTASQFYDNFTRAWGNFFVEGAYQDNGDDEKDATARSVVDQLVCYGIGNFATNNSSNYSGPLWQLALALKLQKTMLDQPQNRSPKQQQIPCKTIKIVYFDPLVTQVERRVLQDTYGMTVLTENERGKRSISDNDDSSDTTNTNATTVFFMPHCPKGLYENVLWANWNLLQKNHHAICIIGNSLITYVERDTCASNSTEKSCLELIQPFVRETLVKYTKLDLRHMPGYFEAAFNDTYVTSFSLAESSGAGVLPERPLQPSESGQIEVL